MAGAGTGSNLSGVIIRNDINDILDPFSQVLSRNGFIGGRIIPEYPVSQPSGEFPKRLLGGMFKHVNTELPEDGHPRRIAVSIGGTSYSVKRYAIEFPLDDWQQKAYAGKWNMQLDGIELMRDIHARNYEIRVADLVQNTASYTEAWRKLTAATPWNDPDADIIQDIENLKLKRDNKVPEPNVLVCSKKIFRQFSLNNGIKAAIAADGAGIASWQSGYNGALARLFGVDEILVGDGYYDDSPEKESDTVDTGEDNAGYAGLTLKPIWNDNTVQLGCILPAGTQRSFTKPAFGYRIHWVGAPTSNGVGMYYEPRRRGKVFFIDINYEIKLVANLAWTQIQGTWA